MLKLQCNLIYVKAILEVKVKMKNKIFIIITVLLGINLVFAEPSIQKNAENYGPNIGHSVTASTPLSSQATIANASYSFNYSWIDPLKDKTYYSAVHSKDPYWSWRLNLEVSPYYGQFVTELGLRAFPFLELGFAFRHMHYFASNVEMGMPQKEGHEELDVTNTWRGSYIYENIHIDPQPDYIHSFDLIARLNFSYEKFDWITKGIFSYVDINEHFTYKSFDYYYMIPMYSRDFMVDIISDLIVPVGNTRWETYVEAELVNEGVFFYDENNKEALREFRLRFGGLYHVDQGKQMHSVIFDAGLLFRDDKFIDNMKFKDRLLLRLIWQINHNFADFFGEAKK